MSTPELSTNEMITHGTNGLQDAVDRAHALLDEDRAAPALAVLEAALASAGPPSRVRAEAMGLA
nr:hypothetical protein [Myxococcota bacterium]